MIGSLRGRLLERDTSGEVLIEVGGIGYRVTLGPAAAGVVGDPGDEVFVHVHHHIREDGQTLYGFTSRDERVCFEALLGANGVGPKLALAILSVHGPADLARVLLDDDTSALCLVPGVGKKTAARLLLDLKSRLDVPDLAGPGTPVPGRTTAAPLADVRDALAGLGYSAEEIVEATRGLPSEGDPSALLSEALRRTAGAR